MPTGPLVLPPLEERPACSIVIPCLNEAPTIEAVVRAAMSQRWPPERLEILVADGGSTDGTRAVVARLAAEDPRVTLVDNPGRYPSAGMNEGIRRAVGAVIVRMDAHAEYALDYVAAAVDALRRTGAATAGGAARARARAPFQRALSAALSSPLGVGGSAYRDPSREGFVESVWSGAFRREAFERVGLFDEGARANEDAELNQRIIEAGGTVYLSRDVVSFYYPRASLGALVRQYFAYGKGRARTLLRRRRVLSPRPLVPFAAVTALAVLVALAAAWPSARPLLVLAVTLYAALVTAEAVRVARRTERGLFPALLVIFPAMHAAHGIGVWAGLCRWAGTTLREPERLSVHDGGSPGTPGSAQRPPAS
jgi:glycosyltransferase involved in cell wall biosynthesis